MLRRTVLSAVAAATAWLAGCGATDGSGDGSRTVNPALRGTPTPTPTATATPTATEAQTPYGAADADALETPRDVVIGNRRLDPVVARVAVSEGDTAVLDRTVRVPGGAEHRIAGVFGADREFVVSVATADGRRTETTWTPSDDGGDFGVDLGATARSFTTYRPTRASAFVSDADDGFVTAADGTAILIVDNPGGGRRVTLTADTGGPPTTATLDVPAESRVAVPLSVPGAAVRLRASAPDGDEESAAFRWQPLADGALVLRLDDAPRFLCDLLVRDLRVRNDRATAATIAVAVTADGAERFSGSFTVTGGGSVTARAAVPPATDFTFDVTVEGETERVDWAVCPPVGPVVVSLTDGGVSVTVRPTALGS